MAEGIFRKCIRMQRLEEHFEVDSAGTGDWHVGEGIDRRARQVLQKQEADFSHTARQITPHDFEHFDYLLAMDSSNLMDLQRLCPQEHRHKIFKFLEPINGEDVPDPYYGAPNQFDRLFHLMEHVCRLWLERWAQTMPYRDLE